MHVISASNHTGNPEGNYNYFQRSFIRLVAFKPIATPLTYSPVKLLFDTFVLMKIFSECV